MSKCKKCEKDYIPLEREVMFEVKGITAIDFPAFVYGFDHGTSIGGKIPVADIEIPSTEVQKIKKLEQWLKKKNLKYKKSYNEITREWI